MKPLLIFLFGLLIIAANAQKDSVFILKCVLSGDSQVMSYCPVRILKNGICQYSTNANSNGIAVVPAANFQDSAFIVQLDYPSHKKFQASVVSLKMNDTVLLAVSNDPVFIGEIKIEKYMVPVIEAPGTRKKPAAIPGFVYSPAVLAEIEKLKQGEWSWTDTSSGVLKTEQEFYQYFNRAIRYPESAYKNNIDGEVYIDFTLGGNKKINSMKLAYGSDPSLILAVANALANIPALMFMEQEYISITENENGGEGVRPTTWLLQAKPPVYRLCVNFKLL